MSCWQLLRLIEMVTRWRPLLWRILRPLQRLLLQVRWHVLLRCALAGALNSLFLLWHLEVTLIVRLLEPSFKRPAIGVSSAVKITLLLLLLRQRLLLVVEVIISTSHGRWWLLELLVTVIMLLLRRRGEAVVHRIREILGILWVVHLLVHVRRHLLRRGALLRVGIKAHGACSAMHHSIIKTPSLAVCASGRANHAYSEASADRRRSPGKAIGHRKARFLR